MYKICRFHQYFIVKLNHEYHHIKQGSHLHLLAISPAAFASVIFSLKAALLASTGRRSADSEEKYLQLSVHQIKNQN